MNEIMIVALSSLGTLFILLAAIGVVRMPDIYLRISVTTKAATLGIGLILLASAVYFSDGAITARILAIILFMLLTAPVGAHMIGRASYFTGVKLWKNTHIDDLEGKYDAISHKLASENKTPISPDSPNLKKTAK